jgi:hypothetical protein
LCACLTFGESHGHISLTGQCASKPTKTVKEATIL